MQKMRFLELAYANQDFANSQSNEGTDDGSIARNSQSCSEFYFYMICCDYVTDQSHFIMNLPLVECWQLFCGLYVYHSKPVCIKIIF